MEVPDAPDRTLKAQSSEAGDIPLHLRLRDAALAARAAGSDLHVAPVGDECRQRAGDALQCKHGLEGAVRAATNREADLDRRNL